MQNQIVVFLDLSEEIEEILYKQHIKLYQIIQEELPEVHLSVMSDPQAHRGEKDLVTTIIATIPFVISAISPIIIRTLNHFKPDTTEIRTEEIEEHHANGSTIIRRISVSIQRQYNQQGITQQTPLDSPKKLGN